MSVEKVLERKDSLLLATPGARTAHNWFFSQMSLWYFHIRMLVKYTLLLLVQQ